MDNKLTRNLSLGALLGLFVLYGHTVHNLRIDSVSTAGIVVKYRGLASVDCKPVTRLETSDSEVCQYTKKEEELPNGGTKYTIVALNKGYKSKESISFTKDELDKAGEVKIKLNTLAKNLLKQSAQKAKDVENGIISLGEVDSTDSEVTSSNDDSEIVVPTDEKDNDESTDENEDTETASVDLDEESLDEALEKYEDLQAIFSTCQLDKKDDKKIFNLVKKHNKTITKYQNKLAKNENDEDEDSKSTFEKLSRRGKEKIQSFADDVAALDLEEIEERAEDNEEKTTVELINCQSKHAAIFKKRSERFEFYKIAIRPLVRELNGANNIEELSENYKALDGGDYDKLLNSTPDIKSVSNAEEALTVQRLTQNATDPNLVALRTQAQDQLATTYNSASPKAKQEIITVSQELNNANKPLPAKVDPITKLPIQNASEGLEGEEIVQEAKDNLARLNALLIENQVTLRQRTNNAKQGTGNAFNKNNIRNIQNGQPGVAAKDTPVDFKRLRQQRAQQQQDLQQPVRGLQSIDGN